MPVVMQIPFFKFSSNAININLVWESLSQKNDFINGSAIAEFEYQYKLFSNVSDVITTSNGLDALKIALSSLELPPGAEVIVPAHTFIASVFAIIHAGLKPVLVDVESQSFNIDTTQIEALITPHTKVLLPVHLYGQASSMNEILQIAQEKKLFIVEDNAQAQGAEYQGKLTGSFGDVNATSFYPSKNLGALGDAGAITTNDPELAHRCRLLRNVGSEEKYVHEVIGHNARMDSIQAAFLTQKLLQLNKSNEIRIKLAQRYFDNLKSCKTVILPQVMDHCKHVFHLFVIRSANRNSLQQYLQNNGIATLIHYPIPNHLQPALKYLGYQKGDFPVTELMSDTCLSLPIYPGLREDEVDYICEKILEFEKLI